jgi:hypothetical protein
VLLTAMIPSEGNGSPFWDEVRASGFDAIVNKMELLKMVIFMENWARNHSVH